MADDLPTEFDVVILGTGLPESIIAAACTRIGQRVLHIDARNYYGGNWASFTFSGLQTWIENCKQELNTELAAACKGQALDNEEIIPFNKRNQTIQNIEVFCYSSTEDGEAVEEAGALNINSALLTTVTSSDGQENSSIDISKNHTSTEQNDSPEGRSDLEEATNSDQRSADSTLETGTIVEVEPSLTQAIQQDSPKTITYSQIVKEGRRFNVDLVSKFLYSRGLLIELLIKSNVSRYTEFKNVTRILTYHNGKIEQVPCSRADVFASKQLSMVEKRILMKFLMHYIDYELHPEDYQDYENSTFLEFLKSKQLTPTLQHFVLYSIAMVPENAKTIEGLKAMQHFLRCLGRYGNTPFLFPMYGLGEIPQCFCRMCAVFGGVYCLHHSLECLVVDGDSKLCKAVIDHRGKRVDCKYVIVEDSYLPEQICANVSYKQISRAVLITDCSILNTESNQEISVLTFPPADKGQTAVYITELCSSTMTCMKNTYVSAMGHSIGGLLCDLVHLTCSSTKPTAKEDLEPVVQQLFTLSTENDIEANDRTKPKVLWALYFNMRDSSGVPRQSYAGLPPNVYVCSGPDHCFGNDHAVQQAENLFHELYPSEEFCPPAPNPEDIIYDGECAQQEPSESSIPVDSKAEASAENETVVESYEDSEAQKAE
uniref:Rab proteins geranylgeranyltransferase component A n=1 Tax=Xenopus tropicalis TaxID=8364 RepID=A0A6I8SAM1_XENTR